MSTRSTTVNVDPDQTHLRESDLGLLARTRRYGLSRVQLAWVLLLPAVVVMVSVLGYPISRDLWMSLHTIRLDEPWLGEPFIGFGNYVRIVLDPDFWGSMEVSVYFTVGSVVIEALLGLAVALVVNESFRGRGLVRTAMLVPWAIPAIVSARMWGWMYSPSVGAFNAVLNGLHIVSGPIDLLSSPQWVMPAVIIADVWKNTPFVALLLLAGLQIIPAELYEAARVDGASGWQRFRHVTFPLLRGSMTVALLFRTLTAFQTFDLAQGLTSGGPGTLTELISLHTYRVLFANVNFGQGAALSVIIAVISLVIAMVYARQLNLRSV